MQKKKKQRTPNAEEHQAKESEVTNPYWTRIAESHEHAAVKARAVGAAIAALRRH